MSKRSDPSQGAVKDPARPASRPDDHALAVDVGDFERDHLSGAQAGAVGYAERRLVLQSRGSIEQLHHFLGAEHHRQLARLVNGMRMLDDLGAPERDFKKEPQCRSRYPLG